MRLLLFVVGGVRRPDPTLLRVFLSKGRVSFAPRLSLRLLRLSDFSMARSLDARRLRPRLFSSSSSVFPPLLFFLGK